MQQANVPAHPDEKHLLRTYQIRAFALTWFSYMSYYLTRKPIGVVKSRLQSELGMSTYYLGVIDTAYLGAYAIGQFINGFLGDRLGPRRLLGFGMLGTACCAFIFGANSIAALLVAFWLLNGLFQSSGWPGNVKAMTPWFGLKKRGTIMGIWGTCYQVGGIVGTGLAAFLLVRWGWRVAFFTPAIWVAIVGGVILFFLVEHPRQRGLPSPADEPVDGVSEPPAGTAAADESGAVHDDGTSCMSFGDAMRLPGILNLGGAYFCLKLIRYTLLLWLPFYLHNSLGYAEDVAGYLSTTFEIGGIAGAIIVGYVSDRYVAGRRAILATPLVFCIGIFLALYQLVAGWGIVANGVTMAMVGFMLFGPDALISGAAAQDLGGSRAAGSAAGIINGLGSLGAILQGIMTAYVTEKYGWDALLYVLVSLAVLATLVLLPLALRSVRPATPGAADQ